MTMKTPTKRPVKKGRKLSCALRDWTERKREAFLAELTFTSNITRSAQSVNLSEKGAYKLRRSDPVFRAAWASALSEGYARLEHMMLERAMNAFSDGEVAEIDPARKRMEEYSNKLAMALLAAHRSSVRGETVRPATPATPAKPVDKRAALKARFAEMRKRAGLDHDAAE
jgi:hypothetical protein